jgi:hypothetical protein
MLAQTAADAFASGRPAPAAVDEAAGRPYELSLPFGCSGPSEAASGLPMRWTYDHEEEVLRISVSEEAWSPADWGLSDRDDAGGARGFWIARPWSTSDSCPPRSGQAVATGVEPITLPGQTLAIAQFFTAGPDQDERRDRRNFDIVERIPGNRFDSSRGFRLRVSGRIERTPAGNPVRCVQPAGIEQRPICVVGARMDEVRIETSTGVVLATWPIGQSG